MLQEAKDFRAESESLAALFDNLVVDHYSIATQFKGWTIEDVIGHLHIWNYAAGLTLQSTEKFQKFFGYVMTAMGGGLSHIQMQKKWFDENKNGLSGKALVNEWHEYSLILADEYLIADPARRVAWAGPDMTTQSKMVARQMETWAHGQEIFDILGMDRVNQDRIRNICDLGVRTYGWTFRNRGIEPPTPKPFVQLTAPSGVIWEWNDPQSDNMISGRAEEFAQIVTQTRNIADTKIEPIGAVSNQWMQIAQCFAGGPETPPTKGLRQKSIDPL